MLHHSNSRQQRNRGSRIKTLLQVTLLLGVVVWLVYQVKHSYDKKNEYFNDTQHQLAHDDRSMFQGRKERVGIYGDGNLEKAVEYSDVSKPEEEKSGETVFEKDNTDSGEDDARNTERSQAEEGQASGAVDNTEAHRNDEDETLGHSAADKHDAELNSSDAESKSGVQSSGDDVPQNNNTQEEITGEINGTLHEEVAQSDGSTSADQTNASRNGSDGEPAEKKEAVESQTDSESLTNEHSTETLPDETGNIPSVHTENSQNDASENQGDAASTTSDAYEHSTSETLHIEIGSQHEGATTSSGTASGDAEKGNSVELNSSDSISVEEKTGSASDGDEKVAETGTANEASSSKEANSEEGNAAAEVSTDQAANTVTKNSQGESVAGAANVSSEEAEPMENQIDGATKTSSNGDQDDIKIETNTSTNDENNEPQGGAIKIETNTSTNDENNEPQGGGVKIETNTSTNDEHNEPQGGGISSGSNGSIDGGPEQTGKTETQ